MFAKNKVKPLKNCNLGWEVHFKLRLKKKNINGKVKNTVKKYLAHVIWKKDRSELKYLAIVSIKGNMAHASKL